MGANVAGQDMSVGFDGGPITSGVGGPPVPVSPPVGVLWAAAVALVAGALLLVVDGLAAHVVGYALSALIAVGFVAAFPRVDAVRRRNRYYSPRRVLHKVAAILAVGAVGVAAVHAWAIANVLAAA